MPSLGFGCHFYHLSSRAIAEPHRPSLAMMEFAPKTHKTKTVSSADTLKPNNSHFLKFLSFHNEIKTGE
jgi:hypothetical protein